MTQGVMRDGTDRCVLGKLCLAGTTAGCEELASHFMPKCVLHASAWFWSSLHVDLICLIRDYKLRGLQRDHACHKRTRWFHRHSRCLHDGTVLGLAAVVHDSLSQRQPSGR